MTPFKDRLLNPDKPIQVYRNLHKGGYSIKQGGLVVAHADELALVDCKMHVCEKGRQRVAASGVKCVHAWLIGNLYTGPAPSPGQEKKLSYNPYKNKEFVNEDGEPVREASLCVLGNGVRYCP